MMIHEYNSLYKLEIFNYNQYHHFNGEAMTAAPRVSVAAVFFAE